MLYARNMPKFLIPQGNRKFQISVNVSLNKA